MVSQVSLSSNFITAGKCRRVWLSALDYSHIYLLGGGWGGMVRLKENLKNK